MDPLVVDAAVARRFVLGSQGLWPARRWRGPLGVANAVDGVGQVQVDPLDVVGQSQDLAFSARVDGYRPAHLERALYRDRTLFEWGGNLQIRSIDELPFLRAQMRVADYLGRWERYHRAHREYVGRVLAQVERRGPLTSRDFPAGGRVASYRSSRDAGIALYYLWYRGELLIHSRVRGERRYDLADRLVPERLLRIPSEEAAEPRRLRRAMRLYGLVNPSELLGVARSSLIGTIRPRELPAWAEREERTGRLSRIRVDGWKGAFWIGGEFVDTLADLAEGRIPAAWRPVQRNHEEEAIFLAPLDIVSARGRAKRLFAFEYKWEVYVPAAKRRWGYYTLPILHAEGLRARADLRYDRAAKTLRVLGFWFEPSTGTDDATFARAVGRGLHRLRAMTGGDRLDLRGIRTRRFRSLVGRAE